MVDVRRRGPKFAPRLPPSLPCRSRKGPRATPRVTKITYEIEGSGDDYHRQLRRRKP